MRDYILALYFEHLVFDKNLHLRAIGFNLAHICHILNQTVFVLFDLGSLFFDDLLLLNIEGQVLLKQVLHQFLRSPFIEDQLTSYFAKTFASFSLSSWLSTMGGN